MIEQVMKMDFNFSHSLWKWLVSPMSRSRPSDVMGFLLPYLHTGYNYT